MTLIGKLKNLFCVLILIGCGTQSNPIVLYSEMLKDEIDNELLLEFSEIDEFDISMKYLYQKLKPNVVTLVDQNRDLESYLELIGIKKDNSRSYLMLTTLHRQINNRSIEIDSLISEVKIWEERIIIQQAEKDKCENFRLKNRNYNISNFSVGDTVNMDIIIVESFNILNGVYYDCPVSIDISDEEILKMKLLILDNDIYTRVDSQYHAGFVTKIISRNRNDVPVINQKYEISDTFYLDFNIYQRKLYK